MRRHIHFNDSPLQALNTYVHDTRESEHCRVELYKSKHKRNLIFDAFLRQK